MSNYHFWGNCCKVCSSQIETAEINRNKATMDPPKITNCNALSVKEEMSVIAICCSYSANPFINFCSHRYFDISPLFCLLEN